MPVEPADRRPPVEQSKRRSALLSSGCVRLRSSSSFAVSYCNARLDRLSLAGERATNGDMEPIHLPSLTICFAILSASAPIVREGLTPNAVGMMAPSATKRFLYPKTSP